MSNALIPLHEKHVGDDAIQTVNARELHAFLGSKKDFSAWIRARIAQYDFTENVDYVTEKVFPHSGENIAGGRPATMYHLTIGMAKELSMVERTKRGKEARQYFLACEKAALGLASSTPWTNTPSCAPSANW